MVPAATTTVIRQIESLFGGGSAIGLSDRELIGQFVARGDASAEAAFAALVARHGPMVLRVCRQFLRDHHHAEDAFQAVFLVLARRAASVRDPDLLSNWLYGVALRTAGNARARIARCRKNDEIRAADPSEAGPAASADRTAIDREQSEALHAEIDRLPKSSRLPVVLCYFEGLSLAEAAQRLHCPSGTLHSRLARARDKLRRGLARRGIVLAGTALAAALAARPASAFTVPLLWDSTTQAAIRFAAGRVGGGALPASAIALARQAIRATFWHELRATASTLLLLVAAAAGAGYLTRAPAAANAELRKASAPTLATTPHVQTKADETARPAAGPGRMFVVGRVLDPTGKPVPGVRVDVVGRPRLPRVATRAEPEWHVLIGCGTTGADGKFRFDGIRTASTRYYEVDAVAASPGYGLGWARLNPDAPEPGAEISLRPEQTIQGRLVDINGQPATGVEFHVGRVGHRTDMGTFEGVNLGDRRPPGAFLAWPRVLKTDNDGRFTLAGIGRGVSADLVIRDPHFASQWLSIMSDNRNGAAPSTHVLQPSTIIEGRVLAADTGQPIPSAAVGVTASRDEIGDMYTTWFRADKEGRYLANPSPGGYFRVKGVAPEGQPFLMREDEFAWTKGTVKRTLDIRLPRGILIRGKVTDEKSGGPLEAATLQYVAARRPDHVTDGWQAVVASQNDGSFQIVVPPGKGHLFAYGPTPDYLLEAIGSRTIYRGQPGGERHYAHRIIPYDVKIGGEPEEINVALRTGKTIKGRVIGLDGQTVDNAEIITTLHFNYFHLSWRGDLTIHARDGCFELHGLDPEKATTVYFLDADHEWGAAVELSGKQAGEDVVVQLQPCGRATARFVDPEGKPVARIFPQFEILGTPGRHEDNRDPNEQATLAADAAYMPNVDRKHYWRGPFTDGDGRITLPDLIPGAMYRISDTSKRPEKGVRVRKTFTVKPGETADLGDILIEKPAR
jgi:RNA polymerase sigma factor (sigma-70 family)